MIPTGKYQFESNSQRQRQGCLQRSGCDSYRKVPIWKQFTTFVSTDPNQLELWFLQESTNLKAIHNQSTEQIFHQRAVIPTGKYQFESNSQRVHRWLWECHAVIPTGKYQFESNSQLDRVSSHLVLAVIPTGKYQFESNSQLPIDYQIKATGCDSYRKVPIWKQFTTGVESIGQSDRLWFLQESTNLKAIHNDWEGNITWNRAVIPTGKYQFESNSQHKRGITNLILCCDSYRKVPIWKQFTTNYW